MGRQLYVRIEEERRAQEAALGNGHDDRRSPRDWVALVCRQLGLAVDDGRDHDPARWRRQMVRVAALAVVALESQDRLSGREAVADKTRRVPGC